MADFFHFNAQGIGILIAICTIGWHALKLLRKIDRGFDVWNWQHGVMWLQYQKDHKDKMPPYPLLSLERAAASSGPEPRPRPSSRWP
jgi:hypothetical protein